LRKMLMLSASLCFVAAAPAMATSVVTLENSSCSLSTGCLFSGNIASGTVADTQAAYNSVKDPDIVLNFLGTSEVGAGSLSGSWDYTGYAIDFLGVKAGNQFILYSVGGLSSGTWSTAGLFNPQGKKHPQLGLSHLAFFGQKSVVPDPTGSVPEPASWAMMLVGFGAMGGVLRTSRRKVAVSFG